VETPVILPALGESVLEGTISRWLKAVGDEVAVDEPLLEVSTDKVDTEIPAPASGILLEIRVAADETAEVGQTIGIIGDRAAAASQASSPAPEPELVAPAPSAPKPQPAAVPVAPPRPTGGHAGTAPSDLYVTPLVRKLASENNVDLATVRGTGVGGRITKQDVFDAGHSARMPAPAPKPVPPAVPAPAVTAPAVTAQTAAAEPAAPAPAATQPVPAAGPEMPSGTGSRTEPLSRLRKVIAQRMVDSLTVSAQLTSVVEADVTRMVALRAKHKGPFQAREGIGLSFMPFFAKAAIEALRAFPVVNAAIDQAAGTVTYHDSVHLGIAVDTPRGLLVPVVRDAQDLTITALNRRIADVAARTRDNKVTPDELSGGTFTITNTGSRGALFDTPIINQPQVAILGTGAMVRRPVVITDEFGADSIAIRTMVYLALTYDHRLVDGADAARFLSAIKARLEGGDFAAELG
jgi:2-oxoglutarate dehydrogenase E2 component (dihydrolipoamide succinyltransferase)